MTLHIRAQDDIKNEVCGSSSESFSSLLCVANIKSITSPASTKNYKKNKYHITYINQINKKQ